MYKLFLRPLLFLLSPETAHHFAMNSLKFLMTIPGIKFIFKKCFSSKETNQSIEVAGIIFPNRIGLAAGFDKNAKYVNELALLGFGHIEIGTVTPKPQAGNSKPRLFRLTKENALINRMGFNNDGVETVIKRLKKNKPKIIVGANIGKNKTTPNASAVKDYDYCLQRLHPYVDYFAINVSSPNTPHLRNLQAKKPLSSLLQVLQAKNQAFENPKPMFVKISPDLSYAELDDVIDAALGANISGIIATNTTSQRKNLQNRKMLRKKEEGGLSGKALAVQATSIVQYISLKVKDKLAIIGVGGIDSLKKALDKRQAGATLLQLYTGLIYQGAGLIKKLNAGLD